MVKRFQIEEDGRVAADPESPLTTIVGGQPQRGLRQKVRIPVGIERVLYLAAQDEEFRARLAEDREAAVAEAGLKLTATEAMVLKSLPAGALEQVIDRVSLPDHGRRRFMKAVAASFVTLAAGSALGGCPKNGSDSGTDSGIETDAGWTGSDAGGALPDSGIDYDSGGEGPAGILPDSGDPDAGS